jgi:HAD superfamily hydrolase (TIGR01484 family)
MRYRVLATDYDGTLAHNGKVSDSTLESLREFIATGRQAVLVTGRELPDLKSVFSELNLFRWVIAENGGLIYEPSTTKEIVVGPQACQKLVELLRERGVSPSVGQSIIATWSPYEQIVLRSIHDLGLEMQVIFNKGAVMVLPTGVNKASGLQTVLEMMKLSRHNVVGVGDAENDHSFLQMVEFSAATANALPSLHEIVDLVLPHSHGQGVEFLIDQILADDLYSYKRTIKRHSLLIGNAGDDEASIPSYGGPLLICGPSGSGKSTLLNRLVDAIQEQGFQFCLIDPEGDYESFEGAVVLGSPNNAPHIEEALHVLEQPDASLVLCLTGIPIPERPAFFGEFQAGLTQLRSQFGRPHWLLLDEAHHLIPADWGPSSETLPSTWNNVVLITVQPSLLPEPLLKQVETVAIIGNEVEQTAGDFVSVTGVQTPRISTSDLEYGEVVLWTVANPEGVQYCKAIKSQRQHHRHRRKYAEGQLPPERSFFFRGPHDQLNLRAQNLILFCQIAEGIDDETWMYHLARGDYSKWFSDSIKDESLAKDVDEIVALVNVSETERKQLVLEAIQRRYTLPSTPLVSLPGAS